MKKNKSLLVRVGPGELNIRLKSEVCDESLPSKTVDLLVSVVLEAMLKNANLAVLLSERTSLPEER